LGKISNLTNIFGSTTNQQWLAKPLASPGTILQVNIWEWVAKKHKNQPFM